MAFKALKILSFLGASAVATGATNACDRELTVAYFNSEPYHYEADGGTVTGLDVDILEAVLDAAGCRWRYEKIPLKRSLAAIQSGLADVAMGASSTPERSRYAYFSVPYRRELMVMFTRANGDPSLPAEIASLSDLPKTDVRIGAHLGSWYGYEYARLFERNAAFRNQVLQSADYDNLYRALVADRVDVVIDDIFNGHAALKRLGLLESTAVHAHVVNDSVTHFMFSRKSVSGATVDKIDDAITAFEKTEEYRHIIMRYVPQDYLKRYPLLSASPALELPRSEILPPHLMAR